MILNRTHLFVVPDCCPAPILHHIIQQLSFQFGGRFVYERHKGLSADHRCLVEGRSAGRLAQRVHYQKVGNFKINNIPEKNFNYLY